MAKVIDLTKHFLERQRLKGVDNNLMVQQKLAVIEKEHLSKK